MTTWAVYLDGVLAGTLTERTSGRVDFIYDPDYLTNPQATPLSRSIPLAGARAKPAHVQNFLAGLLPDNERTLQRWAVEYQTSASNPFRLLRHVGGDTAGAVQIVPEGTPATDSGPRDRRIRWLSDDDFDATVAALHERNVEDWATRGNRHGRWSLAGAQNKIALFRDGDKWGEPEDATPTTHIVKAAIDGYPNHDLNEYACLEVAHRLGLAAAEAEIVHTANHRAFVVRRYDRYRDDDGRWHRLHQEDLCQALGVHPSRKYQNEGGPSVGQIRPVLDETVDDSRRRFFDYLIYNVLIGATDAHAKNFSILRSGPESRLAPLYDVASFLPYTTAATQSAGLKVEGPASAFKIGAHYELAAITETDITNLAATLRIDQADALDRYRELRRDIPGEFEHVADNLDADSTAKHWLRNLASLIATSLA